MSKQTKALHHDLDQLAQDARALLEATADVAGDKIAEARKRLGEALEKGKKIIHHAENEAGGEARAAARCILDHPYQSLAISMALGAAVGWIASRCPSRCLQ